MHASSLLLLWFSCVPILWEERRCVYRRRRLRVPTATERPSGAQLRGELRSWSERRARRDLALAQFAEAATCRPSKHARGKPVSRVRWSKKPRRHFREDRHGRTISICHERPSKAGGTIQPKDRADCHCDVSDAGCTVGPEVLAARPDHRADPQRPLLRRHGRQGRSTSTASAAP